MNKNLINLKRNDLLSVAVPSKTESYTPLPVSTIFDVVDEVFAKNGMTIRKEILDARHGGNKQKMRFIFDADDPKFGFELAILNSYDKSIALKAGIGATAMVCWNLQVMSEKHIHEKHTKEVDEEFYRFMVKEFEIQSDRVREANQKWDSYNEMNISINQRDAMVGDMFMSQELLNTEQINTIRSCYEKPQIQYKGLNPLTLNELYQHTTYAIRNEHPLTFLKTVKGVNEYFHTQFEILNG
jgi:hypothetical protein